jgi:hypothetical protein
MDEDPKFIDLPPQEWKSEREKPREPFFGPGLPNAMLYCVGFIAAVIAFHYLRPF